MDCLKSPQIRPMRTPPTPTPHPSPLHCFSSGNTIRASNLIVYRVMNDKALCNRKFGRTDRILEHVSIYSLVSLRKGWPNLEVCFHVNVALPSFAF